MAFRDRWEAYLTTIIFISAIAFWGYGFSRALKQSSISTAWTVISANWYAMSAMADYITGAVFTSTYIFLHEWNVSSSYDGSSGPNTLNHSTMYKVLGGVLGIIFASCNVFLGNPFLLVYVVTHLLWNQSLTHGLFKHLSPDSTASITSMSADVAWMSILNPQGAAASNAHNSNAKNRAPTWLQSLTAKLLGLFYVLVLACFLVVCILALKSQPMAQGFQYVMTHPWSWTTFVDNLLGVMFTMVYVLVREDFRLMIVIPLWASLLLFGNGATMVYAIYLCYKAMSTSISYEFVACHIPDCMVMV